MANLRAPAAFLAGTLAALALAEGAFRVRDDGAFPHVNFYIPDALLGVRLQPGASERISFAGNPVTSFRVNAQGYRGADWPAPTADDIVVIGDSQVFGLGVEEGETASAVLATTTGRPVLNAGVPTYGPPEYLALTKELLASRHPKTVIVVVNLANDLFERNRPNPERHALWDGWAVRKETAPSSTIPFPGRSWLMNQSHAMFALRSWWSRPDPDADAGFASEGSAADLIPYALDAKKPVQMTIPEAQIAEAVGEAASRKLHVEYELADLLPELFPDLPPDADREVEASLAHNRPGDILGMDTSFDWPRRSFALTVTPALLREGAQLRTEMEPRIAKWLEDHRTDPRAMGIQHALGDKATATLTLASLANRVADALPPTSPLTEFVAAMAKLCRENHAELVVVALPVDVQVSNAEWTKYGKDPADPKLDMSGTRVLETDLVKVASDLGVRALDATDALAAAEPGAFLNGDFHMTAKGQSALAAAIAAKLKDPAPVARARAGLPDGRSRVPTLAELVLAPDAPVAGLAEFGCSAQQLREWLYVDCPDAHGAAWAQLTSGSLETWTTSADGRLQVLTPLEQGRPLAVALVWPATGPGKAGKAANLTVTWTDGDATMALIADNTQLKRRLYPELSRDCHSRMFEPGDLDRGCLTAAEPDDHGSCDAIIACATGTRNPLPTCGPGTTNAGSGGLCYASCTTDPCTEGECVDWMGARVCL